MRTGIAAGLSVFRLFFSFPAAADTAAVAAAAAAAGPNRHANALPRPRQP